MNGALKVGEKLFRVEKVVSEKKYMEHPYGIRQKILVVGTS